MKIGPEHDNNLRGNLQAWLDQYLDERYGEGRARAVITPEIVQVISAYRQTNFKHFLFDLVVEPSLADHPIDEAVHPVSYTAQPVHAASHGSKMGLLYRFESPFVYYPLYVSRMGGTGATKVSLAVFTKGLIKKKAGPEYSLMSQGSFKSATIPQGDLKAIDGHLDGFCGNVASVKARVIKIEGELDSLADLVMENHIGVSP